MARKHNFYLIFNMGLKTAKHKSKTQSNTFPNKQKSLQFFSQKNCFKRLQMHILASGFPIFLEEIRMPDA